MEETRTTHRQPAEVACCRMAAEIVKEWVGANALVIVVVAEAMMRELGFHARMAAAAAEEAVVVVVVVWVFHNRLAAEKAVEVLAHWMEEVKCAEVAEVEPCSNARDELAVAVAEMAMVVEEHCSNAVDVSEEAGHCSVHELAVAEKVVVELCREAHCVTEVAGLWSSARRLASEVEIRCNGVEVAAAEEESEECN